MARILCSYSGIDLKIEHFPLYNISRESHHPIYDLETSKLLEFTDKWVDNKLTLIDSYLLYTALFKSTGLVEFRVPAQRTEHTCSIVAQNMLSLIRMADRIDTLGIERCSEILNLPRFVISPDTKTLDNSKYWLEIWEANYKDYLTGYKTTTGVEAILRKEAKLERLIKDKQTDVSKYSALLADWAEQAAEFPTYDVLDENDKTIPMNKYWKRIISMCAKGEAIFHVPQIDLQDLIEHCEETIPHGSIHAHELMALLRSASVRKHQYLDLGDIDVTSTYRILDAEASVEDANTLALIDSAPKEPPQEKAYPNKISFLKARMKYDLAVAYYKEHPLSVAQDTEVTDTNTESEGEL